MQARGAVTTSLVQHPGRLGCCSHLGACIAHYAHVVTVLTICIAHASRLFIIQCVYFGSGTVCAIRSRLKHLATFRKRYQSAYFA